jgi:hypothetical protein
MSQYNFKAANLLAGTALVALGVAAAGQASADGHAKVVKSSQDKVSFRISGQIHREMHVADDGHSTRVAHTDSGYSTSRIRFHTAAKVNANLKVGSLTEIAMDDNRDGFDIEAPAGGRAAGDLRTRINELHFAHSQFGKLTMGAGNGAANGVNNISVHGVSIALPGGMGFLGGAGLKFRNSVAGADGTRQQTAAGVVNVMGDLDFNSRRPRLRYDTPNIMGFVGSISHNTQQSIEYALRYSGKIFDTKIKAAAGMAQNTSGASTTSNTEEMYGASISLGHSSGLGATFGCHYQNSGDNAENEADPAGCNVQGHFQRKFNEMGRTSLVVEYSQADDVNARGDIASAYGVTVKQDIDAAALDVFAKYTNYDLERDSIAGGLEDIDVFTVGSRIRF